MVSRRRSPRRPRAAGLVIACAALLAVAGCSADEPVVSATSGAPAAAAPSAGAALTPADFAAAVKRQGTVILDVAEGHLPGAVQLPLVATR